MFVCYEGGTPGASGTPPDLNCIHEVSRKVSPADCTVALLLVRYELYCCQYYSYASERYLLPDGQNSNLAATRFGTLAAFAVGM